MTRDWSVRPAVRTEGVRSSEQEKEGLAVHFLETLHVERYSRTNKPTRLCDQIALQRTQVLGKRTPQKIQVNPGCSFLPW